MRAALLLSALLLAVPASAQVEQTPTAAENAPAEPQSLPEGIQIGLSMDRISITADFSGADLTVFGALENPDLLLSRQNRYDVIVVLEGPTRPVVVRRKDRVLGMWINTQSETFVNVPVSYSIASTRPFQDIAQPDSYRRLSLGAENIYLQPAEMDENPVTIDEFTGALRDRKRAGGLYTENIGGVQFLSPNLFRATLRLGPSVPVGTHRARAFLFKQGVFVKEASTQLVIVKSGFEQALYRYATNHGFLYGLFAVALAMVTGWVGRIVFRKD